MIQNNMQSWWSNCQQGYTQEWVHWQKEKDPTWVRLYTAWLATSECTYREINYSAWTVLVSSFSKQLSWVTYYGDTINWRNC